MPEPFWRRKRLEELTEAEWESLCDGCGRCCLHKLEDAASGEVHFTDMACRLLDLTSCRCRRYPERHRHVPGCAALRQHRGNTFDWLPATCAYRLRAQGSDLPAWHPLVSGDPDSVHRAGISVRGRALAEDEDVDLESRIVDWPR